MWTEREVFDSIGEEIELTEVERELAYNIHRKLISSIPEEIRGECRFRYLEDKTKDFALNIKKYQIYSYPKAGRQKYNLIYPRANIIELEREKINFKTVFRFIEIDCNLIEIPVYEFIKFTELNQKHFIKAIKMAVEGVTALEKENNVDIKF